MHASRNLRIGTAVSLALAGAAPAQYLGWIDQFGTNSLERCYGVAADIDGGAFVTGFTLGNLGGPNAGGGDVFVARYDNGGNQNWIRQLGTNREDLGAAVLPDGAGGVFVTGATDGILGGPKVGRTDVFVAHLDALGETIWMHQYGTDMRDGVSPGAMAPDGMGGFFVAGSSSAPGEDNEAFLARIDGEGTELWWEQFGSDANDGASALVADGAGGVFIAGGAQGDLGGTGSGDVFLGRYDASGQRSWLVQFGTAYGDGANGLAADGAGGVFIGGGTYGALGGPNVGESDIFLARYDGAGSRIWIAQFGSGAWEVAQSLAPDGEGGALLWGTTAGKLGDQYQGAGDVFLARYDDAGHRSWLTQLGTHESEAAYGLAADGTGGAFAGGSTNGNLAGHSAGWEDGFIAHFAGSPCTADCDLSGSLNLFDFLCFTNEFNAGNQSADCTGDGVIDLFDFLCFTNAFNTGC